MRILLLLTAFSLVLISCKKLRLDSNMYNSTPLEKYLWDAYEGEVDFRLDDSYRIQADKMHEFNLLSQIPGTTESVRISAIYLGDTTAIATDTVILYCHGNKDHMDFYWQRAKLLAHVAGKHRYGVMMFDYRGFGKSEGESSESGTYADTRAALDWLKKHGLSSDRFIMYGFSLGTSVVCEEASAPLVMRPSKIILEAPFASTEVMVQDASGLAMPSSWFTDTKVDNVGKIGSVSSPLLWMHGTADAFLSIKTHGEPVFAHHPGPKEAVRVEGAGHSTVPQTMGFEVYLNTLEKFIRGH
jgi:pimeloyl-ACP methyl ester carboxylesterase